MTTTDICDKASCLNQQQLEDQHHHIIFLIKENSNLVGQLLAAFEEKDELRKKLDALTTT